MLDKNYWTNRYKQNLTGWDVGRATTPIVSYFDSIDDKSLKILIPGAGNAHEAVYLHQQEFTEVHVCDISPEPITNFLAKHPSFPVEHTHVQDFFTLDDTFDIIVEQTFFCALDPSLRAQYVQQASRLLRTGGYVVGVLFGRVFEQEGPPFGGTRPQYTVLFSPYFELDILADCHNSIPPRQGAELFIKLAKKDGQ